MADSTSQFLGRGWSFPPSFSRGSATTSMVSEAEDIRESLRILLSTAPGERIMVPQYGCALWRMVFESLDATLLTRIQDAVRRAILHWEPRITVDKIDVRADRVVAGLVRIDISYAIRGTNSRSNFVFPFYLREGTIAPPTP
jgi:uncharacterized protein